MPELLSNTQLKSRLLGAGILVLAAVIVIPLFLGDPKYVEEQAPEPVKNNEFESRIQPLPGTVPTQQNAAEQVASESSESGGLVLKKLDNQQPPVSNSSELVVIQPLRLDKLDSKADSTTAKIQKQAAAKPKPVASKKTALKTNTAKQTSSTQQAQTVKIKSGWVVQAGIFSKPENAKAIAGILTTNGYTPNISDAKASFGEAKRVWIGPFASKSEAKAISKRLEQQTGDGGFVAAYPFKS